MYSILCLTCLHILGQKKSCHGLCMHWCVCVCVCVCLPMCACSCVCVYMCMYIDICYVYFQSYSHFAFMSHRWTNRRRGRRRLAVPSVVFSTIAVLSTLYKVLAAGGDLMQTHKWIFWNGMVSKLIECRNFVISVQWVLYQKLHEEMCLLSHSAGLLVDSIGIKLWYMIL
jgi:hypothetical protein